MPWNSPARPRVRRIEGVAAALIVAASVILKVLNRRPELSGPDAVVYLDHAAQSQLPGFWADPASFGDNYWPMGYSTALGLLDRVVALTPDVVQGLQILLASATALLCWQMTRPLGLRTALAVLAAVALCPDMSWAGRSVAYEGLLAFLITVTMWATWSSNAHRTGARVVVGALGGLAFGFAVLVSGRALILVPLLVWLAYRRGWPLLAPFAVASSIPIVMWTVRNVLVTGASTPLSGNLRINLWIGNNPEATTGGYMAPPIALNGYLRDALAYFLADPGGFLSLSLRRQARLFTPMFDEFTSLGTTAVGPALLATIVALLMAGGLVLWWAGLIWSGRTKVPAVAPAAFAATVYLIAAMPFLIEPRFRVPVTPLILVTAVPTLIATGSRIRERHRSRVRAPA